MKDAYITELFDLNETIAADIFEGLTYPWEALGRIGDYIRKLGPTLDPEEYEKRGEDIWVHKSAVIFPSAYIGGPCIICEGAELRHSAFIRGSAIVGKKSVIGNSTELKNVLLFNSVQVPHFNYVGDSILGFRSHMGAGSIASNLKADKKNIVIRDIGSGESIETGLKKIGAILGDFADVGCNCVLNPGTILGRRVTVYPTSSVRGVIKADHIYKGEGNVVKRRVSYGGLL